MPQYFYGGELGSYLPSSGTIQEFVDNNRMDEVFSRCYMFIDAAADFVEGEPVNSQGQKIAISDAQLWHHNFVTYRSFNTSGAPEHTRFIWYDDAGAERIRLRYNYGNEETKLQYHNGVTWITVGTIIVPIQDPNGQYIDINVENIGTANGRLRLYVGSTLRIESLAGLDLSMIANLRKWRWFGASNGGINFASYISQTIVNGDIPTVGWRLMTAYVSNQGAETAFGGALGYQNIDEINTNDADFIDSNVADQYGTFIITPQTSLDPYANKIRGFATTIRCRNDGAGLLNMRCVLRRNGVNYDNGADLNPTVGMTPQLKIWDTDPDTGGIWTPANILATQPGIRSRT